MPQNRDKTGKFTKGNNANPGGRPAVAKDFRERCQAFMTEKGWHVLVEMVNDPKCRDRFRSAELIANYAYGKPRQAVSLGADEELPTLRIILEGKE